jgi:uncharacterized RDD family membrane protein YckC
MSEEQKPLNYAGFWIRFVAFIIDGLILNTLAFILILPILGMIGFASFGISELTNMDPEEFGLALFAILAPLSIANLIMYWLYFAVQQSSSWQATLGKRAVGIIVTDVHGERLTFTTASLRYLGRVISNMTMLIGYIIAAFTEKKQALHDLIAGSVVVFKD